MLEKNELLKKMFITVPNHIKERCVIKVIEPHKIFLRKEDKIEDIYIVSSGSIRVINEYANGTIYGFAYVEAGDVIGAMELLSDHDMWACSLEAITECYLISMSVEDFMNWFEDDHLFSKAMGRMLARKFFPTSFDYGLVFKEEAIKAVASYLYKFVKNTIDSEEVVSIKITRRYLSEELGVSTRTIYRTLKKLVDLQCISVDNSLISVNKKQCLNLEMLLRDNVCKKK